MYENQAKTIGPYANGGMVNAQPFATKEVGIAPLDQLAKQLEAARERLTQHTTRIRTLADSLFGAEPSSGSDVASSIKPPPFGRLQGLNEQASGVQWWIDELERQIGRLNPLG